MNNKNKELKNLKIKELEGFELKNDEELIEVVGGCESTSGRSVLPKGTAAHNYEVIWLKHPEYKFGQVIDTHESNGIEYASVNFLEAEGRFEIIPVSELRIISNNYPIQEVLHKLYKMANPD